MPRIYISSVIDAPAAKVWERIRDFNGLPQWHPGIADSRIIGLVLKLARCAAPLTKVCWPYSAALSPCTTPPTICASTLRGLTVRVQSMATEIFLTANAVALLPKAVDKNVAFVPGAPFYCQNPDHSTLRLSFATVGEDKILEGAERLKQALHA